MGSLVAPDRLRFDFVHPKPITPEELNRIEDIANEVVLERRGKRRDWTRFANQSVVRSRVIFGLDSLICGSTARGHGRAVFAANGVAVGGVDPAPVAGQRPDANSVTSCPASASPSARSETIHSIPP